MKQADFFENVVAELKNTFDKNFYQRAKFIPSRDEVVTVFETFKNLLFQYPLATKKISQPGLLKTSAKKLEKQILNSLCFLCHGEKDCKPCHAQARQVAQQFVAALPEIQQLIITDIHAAFEGDPAAIDEIEPLLCYPGVLAVAYQRMAHFLYKKGISLIPRIITEHAHSLTGIDIHPGAQIGPAFFIDHGTGVVIGETSVIGANVKLYQGVTLGAKSFPLDKNGNPVKGVKRHPNLGDGVIVYAEATILGDITIGAGSVIGANKWVTHDVLPNTKLS